MKKNLLLIWSILGSFVSGCIVVFGMMLGLTTLLGLTGCSMNVPVSDVSAPTEETYVVEVGIVSSSTEVTVKEMAENISGEVSFSDICKIRDYLYANTETDDYEIYENVTFEELKSMFVRVSHTNGLEIANGIKEHGSYIGTFNHRNYSYKKIWICVTKTSLLY